VNTGNDSICTFCNPLCCSCHGCCCCCCCADSDTVVPATPGDSCCRVQRCVMFRHRATVLMKATTYKNRSWNTYEIRDIAAACCCCYCCNSATDHVRIDEEAGHVACVQQLVAGLLGSNCFAMEKNLKLTHSLTHSLKHSHSPRTRANRTMAITTVTLELKARER